MPPLVRTSNSKDEAYAWLCGLFTVCETPPTIEEATRYARAEGTLMSPMSVIEILKAKNWDDVVKKYLRYISRKVPDKEVTAPKTKRGPLHRYTDEELIEILCVIYQEVGELRPLTYQEIITRSKRVKTPHWNTLVDHLGHASGWPKIVADYEAKKVSSPQHIAN